MKRTLLTIYLFITICLCTGDLFSQNPLILDNFTADPAARVFEGKVYFYPSHDILANEERGRVGWFCMEDYHVYSSENLTDWKDHGVIVSQNDVPWVNSSLYSMWAPDCISRNGKYYFYFPAPAKDTTYGRGFSIGVAVSDKPEGPYIPQPEPIKGARGIDPNLFIDKDGQAYIYWAARNIYVAKLKDNMLELASEPQVIKNLPEAGLKEGPYLFERNGIYYLTYPHVENKIERLEYAIGNSPLGPFEFAGVIMDESPTGCWTNHQSIIEFKNQWYLFYHHNDLSPEFDKNRSTRVDSLFFNSDGTIKKVIPTLRGVGISDAFKEIQIDRYSAISENGVKVDFINNENKKEGWETIFSDTGAWIRYNKVDFNKRLPGKISVKGKSSSGGKLLIKLSDSNKSAIASITIPANNEWNIVNHKLTEIPKGIHDLVIESDSSDKIEIDWIRFE